MHTFKKRGSEMAEDRRKGGRSRDDVHAMTIRSLVEPTIEPVPLIVIYRPYPVFSCTHLPPSPPRVIGYMEIRANANEYK